MNGPKIIPSPQIKIPKGTNPQATPEKLPLNTLTTPKKVATK